MLRKGEDQFILAIIKDPKTEQGQLSEKAQALLTEFTDVFLDKLPSKLPPIRSIDHRIKLVPGATPMARPVYHMSPRELKALKEQLEELIASGYIHLS